MVAATPTPQLVIQVRMVLEVVLALAAAGVPQAAGTVAQEILEVYLLHPQLLQLDLGRMAMEAAAAPPTPFRR